jgi:2-keto-3-deoxy-L-rhamnonate aldolase RhmA
VGNLQKLKDKIANGGICFGIMVTITDCCVSEMIGYAGYDFAWIDTEHGALDRREIFHHILAAQAAGAAAFVRVPGTDPTHVKAILDMGPDGIIFPFVNNAERAEEAVKACLYPPKGMRGQGPIRAIKYGIDDENEYIKHHDELVWKICQIETEEGYNNLDEIMKVEGIDSLFVGPADLGRSITLPEPEKSKRIGEIMEDLPRRIKQNGMIVGTGCGPSPEDVAKTVGHGYSWMFVGQDARLISDPLVKNLKKLKEIYK